MDLLEVLQNIETPLILSDSVTIMLVLSIISFVPFLLVSTTSFLRITIIFGLLRSAMGTQQSPPNMIIVGIALFMTIFIMSPVWNEINETAVKPYLSADITQAEALELAFFPIREFMFKQTKEPDLALFAQFAQMDLEKIDSKDDIPIYVLIPAFIISELKTAFMISFVLFLPFILVDLLVANILLSLGMMMLSPVMISLPFKILLFVMVDGFNLIVKALMQSYMN
jgi:flagellar biosynthesis protein FliP